VVHATVRVLTLERDGSSRSRHRVLTAAPCGARCGRRWASAAHASVGPGAARCR